MHGFRTVRSRALWLLTPLFILLLGVAGPATGQGKGDKVTLQVVKYDGLGDIIRKLRGKVIVVDFYQDTWVSCKREMPHLVEMQKKYQDQGFAAVTVALDDPSNEQVKQSLLRFLKKIDASFTNVILDEKEEVWSKKLGFFGVPVVYVFNREGKYKKHEAPDIEDGYTNIEKLVVEWLQQKK